MELKILVENGYIEGAAENGGRVWKGIPYAAEYTGNHRFKAAKPAGKWDGVLKTTAFPPPAPQLPKKVCGIEEGVPTDENSLCINVWAPEKTVKKCPVMVWIFGGAFVSGDAGIDLYDGAKLAAEENIIVASFNYRINALGFIDFSSVIPEAESNVGLRDQVLALKWIYENIEAFGGDSENITLFGQSAGGFSVTALLSIPDARKYIAKAIAMSPYPLSVNTKEQAAAYAARFLDLMGIETQDARKLFMVTADELATASKKLEDEVSTECNFEFAFAPVVDGGFLPVTPFESASSSQNKEIPLIVGNVTDEGSMYAFSPIPFFPTTDETIEKFFGQNNDWDRNVIETLYGCYPAKRRKDKLGGDILFGVPCLLYADAYSKNAPVWMYRFAYHPIALRLKKLYTMHGTDMPFAFNNLKCTIAKQSLSLTLNKSGAERVKREFSHELASFAATGKAGWETYSENGRIYREFNKKNKIGLHPLAQTSEVFRKTAFFKRKTALSKYVDTK